MGTGASASVNASMSAASPEELVECLQKLPSEQMAKLNAALGEDPPSQEEELAKIMRRIMDAHWKLCFVPDLKKEPLTNSPIVRKDDLYSKNKKKRMAFNGMSLDQKMAAMNEERLIPGDDFAGMSVDQKFALFKGGRGWRTWSPVASMVKDRLDSCENAWNAMVLKDISSKSDCVGAITVLQEAWPKKNEMQIVQMPGTLNGFSFDELFGRMDADTSEWYDGVVSEVIRSTVNERDNQNRPVLLIFVVGDGGIEAGEGDLHAKIEKMRTLLDPKDSVLRLDSNEKINISRIKKCKILFLANSTTCFPPEIVPLLGPVLQAEE